jgi:hypothetical protein
MLFRIVHYSEWPKLRPAHLFFLGSAFEQLTPQLLIHHEANSSISYCFFDFGSGTLSRQNTVHHIFKPGALSLLPTSVRPTTQSIVAMATATDDALTKVSTEGKSLPRA